VAKRKSDPKTEIEDLMSPGFYGRDPVRVKVYIFPNQLEMLEKIAAERGVTKRHIFFECFGFYIGNYLQEEADRRSK